MHLGEPSDANEAAQVAWMPLVDVVQAIAGGTITDGFTQLAVVLAMARSGYGQLLESSTAADTH